MTRILVYAAKFKNNVGPQRKLGGIEFAEICEADQFEDTFQRASKVSPTVCILQLDNPMQLARVAAYGLAGIINEPK